ncbi:CBN-LIPS-7 protein [Aphelenchoides fujianensis]|nr:CBN-LIPS-7 protein [Aphelenchoides fujianensis]
MSAFRLLTPLFLLLSLVDAKFGGDFRAFVHNKYGVHVAQQLERADLGNDASMGGSNPGEASFQRRGRHFGPRDHEQDQPIPRDGPCHWKSTATRAGFRHDLGRRRRDARVGLVEMKCSYVKQLRSLIIAVFEYTGHKVDIHGQPSGSKVSAQCTISFLAILGGLCADTREVIGPPITELVDTFLSVAGANSGTSLCFVPIPVGTCNKKNGLHCDSEFLADINAQTRYEGDHIFSIFSTHDDKVGFRACGRLTSPIRKEDGYVLKRGLNHDQTMDSTHNVQINLIRKHSP